MKVGKSIVFNGKMGMRKFWSVALPFSKVACAVKAFLVLYIYGLIGLSAGTSKVYRLYYNKL